MMQHRHRGVAEVFMHHSNTSYEAFMPWLWYLTGLENGKQELLWLATSLLVLRDLWSTKRLVVESLSDIETSNFKALLTCHFLISFKSFRNVMLLTEMVFKHLLWTNLKANF